MTSAQFSKLATELQSTKSAKRAAEIKKILVKCLVNLNKEKA